jgi:hypothetical protein
MYVGMATLRLALDASHSLKEKRMVVRRVKDRVRERVGVAVAEVGDLDVWQRAELGVVVASGARAKVGELLDEILRVVAGCDGAQLIAVARDVTTFELAPAPIAIIDDRTGAGDKAQAVAAEDPSWIPASWRDDDDPAPPISTTPTPRIP